MSAMGRIMKALLFSVCLFGLAACTDEELMPTDAGPTAGADGGVPGGFVLESANLEPAARAAESDSYQLRGHLRSSSPQRAENETKEMRGGFVPLTR